MYGAEIRPMQAAGVLTQFEHRLSARVWLANVERTRPVCRIDGGLLLHKMDGSLPVG